MRSYNSTSTAISNNSISSKQSICLLTAFLAFASFVAKAQDRLVGLTSNGGPEGKGTAFSIKTNAADFSIIKGFADWGSHPTSDLTKGTDGFLYGMIPEGGTHGHGTIFKMTSTGTITVLKNFNMSIDGGYPKGSLIQASDGNFYGMASAGSVNNGGCIFRITPQGKDTIMRSLSINTDGGRPQGHLVQAKDGNFYGMNSSGGAFGYGNIFKMTPSGTYTVLKSFSPPDGTNPYGSLVQASDGNFYGMTYLGGTYALGTVFRITPAGTYTVLRHFNSNGLDGQHPKGDLIQAKDGYLYGLTSGGGINYNGTMFRIKTDGTSFTVIRSFSSAVEGGNPQGSLLQALDGSFYGTAYSMSGGYSGSVFKVTTSGVVSAIKKFTAATEGGFPMGGLVQLADGQLYGMTNSGGKDGSGTIFKVTTSGSMTVLNSLNGSGAGNMPQDNLVLGKDSAYYGITTYGGLYNYGTVFKICGRTTTTLHSFNNNVHGGNPAGGLVRAKDGNFYGMTEVGGRFGGGTIYKITPTGAFTVLRHFKGATDGQSPRGTLVQGVDSALYGITNNGGTGTGGTIFKITTTGTFTVLRNLVPATDGNSPEAGLVLGKDGIFYGMTGTSTRFFKITKDGVFTILRTLSYSVDGNNPHGSMVQATDGNFYGTLNAGGTYGNGAIFKITPDGTLTNLRHLSANTDGGSPKGGLIQASDGNFYGTTSTGGTNKAGTVFKITPAGNFTVLRHLDLVKDGGAPFGGLILAPQNALVANSQSNLVTNEDVAKAIVLTGSGGTGFTFTIVTPPKNGSVNSGTTANRTYTPRANYSGKDSFAFTINIGCLASAPAWVTLNVNSVNDAPVLKTIGNKTVVAGSVLSFTATATDVDPGQSKTFSLVGAPAGATINATTGAFSWKPTTPATHTFKVKVTDNGSPVLYDEEQITVTVTAPALTNSGFRAAKLESSGNLLKSSIYPNPVVNRFTLALKKAGSCTIRIVDMKGGLVMSRNYNGENSQLQVEASQLSAGQYLLQIQAEGEVETLKLIKL